MGNWNTNDQKLEDKKVNKGKFNYKSRRETKNELFFGLQTMAYGKKTRRKEKKRKKERNHVTPKKFPIFEKRAKS